ncbi:IreB family regulatory phosphoprotein, partial [Ruminococcus bicirculans (ex Wegman et al. 2014)]|uniref:IreB family regulatory phosphoprotein n=1 Tax=Ruminococcus bicirculans (ex Wegman et al. 2014) TaxID=1160721 RepID=UPI003FD7BEBA
MHEQTMEFSVQHDKEAELKKTLTIIYDALKEKGYNPVSYTHLRAHAPRHELVCRLLL